MTVQNKKKIYLRASYFSCQRFYYVYFPSERQHTLLILLLIFSCHAFPNPRHTFLFLLIIVCGPHSHTRPPHRQPSRHPNACCHASLFPSVLFPTNFLSTQDSIGPPPYLPSFPLLPKSFLTPSHPTAPARRHR